MKHFGLHDVHGSPTLNKFPPLFDTYSPVRQFSWLCKQARKIRELLTMPEMETPEQQVSTNLDRLDAARDKIEAMKENGRYQCPHCTKKYKSPNGIKKHLKEKHDEIAGDPIGVVQDPDDHDPVVPTLIKLLFLQKDTTDAYRHSDGDRAFRNAKVEFLYLYAQKHTKYRLWIWRMLAYEIALLSPRQAAEYKWNIAVNTAGGIGSSIPNDNFVELQVKNIKQNLAHQGPNKCFKTAQIACKTSQVVTSIMEGLLKACGHWKGRGRHVDGDTSCDIIDFAKAILQAGLVDNPGQSFEGFEHFKDPVGQIRPTELHNWINKQKKTAADFMRCQVKC